MLAYLLTWNPKRWTWPENDARQAVAEARSGRGRQGRWSCGNRTSLPIGSRVFLMRQGTPTRGIVGLGVSTSEPEAAPHYDADRAAAGDTANYVGVRFDALVPPYGDELLAIDALPPRLRKGVTWDTRSSGVAIADDLAVELEAAWEQKFGEPQVPQPPGEGRTSQERSITIARRKCRDSAFAKRVRMRSLGRCAACSIDVDYEALGVLEAAHIKSVEADGPYDLGNALPLCPTHHGLFDGFLWTIEAAGRVVVSDQVPASLKGTFAAVLKQPWDLHPGHLEWHRSQDPKRQRTS